MLTYDYGTSGGTGDQASRIVGIKDGGTTLAGYQYLGLGAVIEVDYSEPDVRYLLYDPAASANIYTGLDRFGRIIDSRWEDYGSSTDVARIQYGYDRASNRVYRDNMVDTTNSFDEYYKYDGLQRLKHTDRGALNATKTGISTLKFAQCWALDATGNWEDFQQDDNGNGIWNLVQQRTANSVNEITSISETAGPSWADPVYDATGNMTTVPQSADPTLTYTATYDAWNRLLTLNDGSPEDVQINEYDGLGRRVTHKSTAAGTTVSYFYSSSWQLLETRTLGASDPRQQHVWGLRYIDDLVLRDLDTTSDGTLDERLYALQDANWNVTAITDENGDVQERYAYESYGTPNFLTPAFGSRASSDFDWETLFGGYRWDGDVGLYQVRNRVLHSACGSWLTRDFMEYDEGLNLYEYALSNPAIFSDPFGLIICWGFANELIGWWIKRQNSTTGDRIYLDKYVKGAISKLEHGCCPESMKNARPDIAMCSGLRPGVSCTIYEIKPKKGPWSAADAASQIRNTITALGKCKLLGAPGTCRHRGTTGSLSETIPGCGRLEWECMAGVIWYRWIRDKREQRRRRQMFDQEQAAKRQQRDQQQRPYTPGIDDLIIISPGVIEAGRRIPQSPTILKFGEAALRALDKAASRIMILVTPPDLYFPLIEDRPPRIDA